MRRSFCLYQQRKNWLARFESIWNERTGASEIALLKESVVECSQQLDSAHQELNRAKLSLENSWNESTSLQREHSDLLRSRDLWTSEDANRFAALLQREVTLRDDLAAAKTQAKNAEDKVGSLRLEYMDRLRRRYQEEQVWQDKWRILGTYGTWSLIVLNSVVFGISQILYQRRELERMRQMEALLDERLPRQKQSGAKPPKTIEECDPERPDIREKHNHEASGKEGSHCDENSAKKCAIDSAVTETSKDETPLSVQRWSQSVIQAMAIYRLQIRDSFHLPSALVGAAAAGLLFAVLVQY